MESRLSQLFKKYIERTATAAERQEFLLLVERESAQEELDQLVETEMLHGTIVYGLENEEKQEILKNIYQFSNEDNSESTIRQIPLRSRILKYAAIVAIPLITGAAIYFSNYHKGLNAKQTTISVNKKSANGVILVLENGDQIDLNAQNESKLSKNVIKGTNELDYSKVTNINQLATYNTLIVPKGSDYKLVLDDSTQIWVNADSRIKYQINFDATKTREVYLEKGEAYFKVTKNPAKPFIVHKGEMNVEVLGTSFNINAYSDIIQTTLVEGKVNVSLSDKENFILTPGQQANFEKSTGHLEKQDVDVYPFVAWKEGVVVFQNVTMEELMGQIERLYDLNVVFKDESLKQLHVTARADKSESINNLLDVIQSTDNLKFTIKERSILVEKSRK